MTKEIIENLINLYKNVASKDETRYHLNGVMVEAGKRKDCDRILVATDGHILAVVEMETSELKPGYYSPELIERMGFYLKQKEISLCESITPAIDVKYPHWRQFATSYDLEEKREIHRDEKELPKYSVISLNPKLVDRLGKGLGLKKGEGLKFIIKDSLSAVQVHTGTTLKRGMIMPMRV